MTQTRNVNETRSGSVFRADLLRTAVLFDGWVAAVMRENGVIGSGRVIVSEVSTVAECLGSVDETPALSQFAFDQNGGVGTGNADDAGVGHMPAVIAVS